MGKKEGMDVNGARTVMVNPLVPSGHLKTILTLLNYNMINASLVVALIHKLFILSLPGGFGTESRFLQSVSQAIGNKSRVYI